MKDQTGPGTIVSRFEIAAICKVTRQGVASVISHPDFPAPICYIGKNKAPLFTRVEVQAFQNRRDKAAAEAVSAAAEPAAA